MAERALSAPVLSAIAAGLLRPVILYEGEYVSGGVTQYLRLFTGVGQLEWDGKTWTGGRELLSFSPIRESTSLEAIGFSVRLAGMDASILSVALQAMRKNKAGRLWLGFADTYSSRVMSDEPVAYWRLNEKTGASAEDIAGTDYDGTYVGGVTLGQPGPIVGDPSSRCLTLPGNSTAEYFLKDPFTGFPSADLSCEFWVKCTGSGDGMVAYGGGNNFMFFGQNAINIYMGTNIATGVNVADDVWHHLVLTWVKSSGALKLYKDGGEAFSGTHNAGGTITNGLPLFIGQEPDSGTPPYNFDASQAMPGSVCELAFYDRVLEAAEVLEHYQAGIGRLPPSIIPSPYPLRRGRFDMAPITRDAAAGTITIEARYEGPLARLLVPNVRHYTHEDQQLRLAGDRGFEQVPALQDTQDLWGNEQVGGTPPRWYTPKQSNIQA